MCLKRSYSRDDLQTQFTSDGHNNETKKMKNLILVGVLNADWSPPHAP